MRVVFLGNDRWSVPTLRALADHAGTEVALVGTAAPKPAGRGSELRATEVADEARARSLPLIEVDRIAGHLDDLRAAAPDVLVVVAYGEILRTPLLELAPLGAVNVHFSLLPRWRGAAPVQRAILEGDDHSGVTTMLMSAGLDTGPILMQREEPISDTDDAASLGNRLAAIGAELIVETLASLDVIEPRAQVEAGATYAPKIEESDEAIDWTEPAVRVERRIRAMSPSPGAWTTFRGKRLKIFKAHADTRSGTPGTVVEIGTDRLLVGAGTGSVLLQELAIEGRRRMPVADWLRGARTEAGEVLG
jgi:methionyl-tRNA formyltransferase